MRKTMWAMPGLLALAMVIGRAWGPRVAAIRSSIPGEGNLFLVSIRAMTAGARHC